VAETTAEVEGGQDLPLTITLTAPPAPAAGLVQGAFVDAAGAGIAVTVRVVGNGIDQPFQSEASGLIALELPAGDYTLTTTAAGFLPDEQRVTVPPGGQLQVRGTLQRDAPPDTPLVSASPKGIRLRSALAYKGDEVASRSFEGLDQLALFLSAHPEYRRIEVQVHTDDQGNPTARAQARADAVKNYLVGKGVDPTRIDATGKGASAPVAVNLTAAGRAKNNRTLLLVRDYDAASARPSAGGGE